MGSDAPPGGAPRRSDEPIIGWSAEEILAEVQELGEMGAWAWRPATDEAWWSGETYRIFGLDQGRVEAGLATFLECVHPDDRDLVEATVREALTGEGTYDLRHRVVHADGEVRYVRLRGRLVPGTDGGTDRMLGIVLDVTDDVRLHDERNRALAALADSEERHRLLVENAYDVIWTMETDGSISYVSPSVTRVRGITPAEAAAQTLDQIHPPESAAKVADYFGRLYAAMADGAVPPMYHGEHEYYRKDGSIMLGALQVIPQVDGEGRVVRILGVTRDITSQRMFEDELMRLAVTDPLTDMWNRRRAEERLEADIAEARRYGVPVSMLMLDIDRFKGVNDTYGHRVGDEILLELTRRIDGILRAPDVLARWGGEEFVVVLRHYTLADALVRAEQVRAVVADTDFPGVGPVTISIGAAEFDPQTDLETWLDQADRAMYAAKAAGRNCVRAHRLGSNV